MRLFVAINLSDNIKNYLFDLQRSSKNNNYSVNWVAKKNLHLTLKFLGNIPESRVNEIKDKLKEVNFDSFAIKLVDIGLFPDIYSPKVIWLGLSPEMTITKLQLIIDEALIGFGKQETKFKSHLTLGRIKNIKDKKKFIELINNIKIDDLSFKVNDFILYKSVLSKDGPKYEVLEVYDLK